MYDMLDPMGPQIGLPGSHRLDKQMLAEAGVEMHVDLLGGLAIASGIASAISGHSAQNAQAAAQNEYRQKKYDYDMQGWEMSNQKLNADWAFNYADWEARVAADRQQTDLVNQREQNRYNYDLQIVKAQREAQKKAYEKSEYLYSEQINFNIAAARDASENALLKQYETIQETAFKNEDAVIKAIEAESELANVTQAGVSKGDLHTSLVAARGRDMAMLSESLLSLDRNTKRTLQTIARDKYGADLAAFAEKMLEPGLIPDPIAPIHVDYTDIPEPRPLQAFDYGPEPVMGVEASGGSFLSLASSAVGSVAGGIIDYNRRIGTMY